MPTTTITVSNQYLSTTLHQLLKEGVDQLFRRTSWFDASKRKFGGEGKPTWDGGAVLLEPWMIDEHSIPTVLTTGYEPINLVVTAVDVVAQWTPFSAIMPIVISGTEDLINSGKVAISSILERRKSAVLGGFQRRFVRQLFAGDVSGFSALGTLNGVDYATGYLEEDTVGSQTNTVGGLSKSTYAALPGCQNQRYDAAGSFNSNGLAALIACDTRIRSRHPMGAGADAWFFSESFAENQKHALQAYERYAKVDDNTDPGRIYALWNGVPTYVETFLPRAGANTAANPISAVGVSMDYLRTMWHPQGFFKMSDFMGPTPTQDIRAAHVRVMCQNVIAHLGSQALIVDADNW